MEKIGEIKVLGTPYGMYIDTNKENPKMRGGRAYVELWSKKIVFSSYESYSTTIESLFEYAAALIRHEIIHAMFHECGLTTYGDDEVLVEWLSQKMPQLHKVCKEAIDIVGSHLIKE